MKATYVMVVLVLCSLIGGLGWAMSHHLKAPATTISDQEAARFADATKVLYQSEMGEITVEYISNLARVTGGVYDGVVFRQIVAASGAKYEAEKGVTLWTKNNEVRIETPQQVVYIGISTPPETPEPMLPVVVEETQIATSTTVTTTTEESDISEKTWVWESAVADGVTIKPKKPDAFSITFTRDGMVQGKTDCNGFGGEYTVTDAQINLGPLQSTLMFCENSEETLFLPLFQSPLLIQTLTDTTLIVQNAADETITFAYRKTVTQ